MTRVTTGSRLHFGLFRLPPAGPWPGAERYYGGVGLMVERPGVRVAVGPAAEWGAAGPLAGRALAAARRCAAALPAGTLRPHYVTVEDCAPEHVGLGTGTQLDLAVARALAHTVGVGELPATELARLTGRGRRSAVGVHGFDRGGFLVDGGKLDPDTIAPLVARVEFPAEWRVVLLTPAGGPRWHGAAEDEALAAAGAAADDALCRLALLGLLPALAERDLPAFGAALAEFNARAGEAFRAAQGGTYAGPATAALVAWLRDRGVRGAGQSSWGPTAFGVVGDEDEAAALAAAARQAWGGITAVPAAGRNRGAATTGGTSNDAAAGA
jgi:beta-ribofuranosylaminobenzene 5'-phosphate synthase